MNYEVLRIPRYYVKDDFVQVRFGYKNRLILFDTNRTLFFKDLRLEQPEINSYMTDIRKNGLPYSNIPTYKEEEIISFCYYTNQILEYDRPYISFVDDGFKLSYVLKDNDGTALLVSKEIRFPQGYLVANKADLLSQIKENLKTVEEPYLIIDGTLMQVHSNFGITLDDILEDLCKYISVHIDELPLYHKKGENQSNLDDIESAIGPIYFVRTDGHNIFMRKFQLRKFNENHYSFEFSDIEGIKILSLEEIKNSKISLMPDPNINLIFNPEYEVEDLEQAKTLIKTFKQSEK